VFGSFLTITITLMHVYVIWRVCTIPFVRRHVPLAGIIGAGSVAWALFFLGRTFGYGGQGAFSGALELAGMNWMASLFLLFLSILTVDIVTGFGFFLPQKAPILRGYGLIAGVMLSLFAIVQGMRPPAIISYDVSIANLPPSADGRVIATLSDLHLGSVLGRRWLDARVRQTMALDPDIIVLLGDIFEGHGLPADDLSPVLRRLTAPLGVYAVLGNHKFHGRGVSSETLLNDAGIQVLRNSWTEPAWGFIVAGVDDFGWNGSGREEYIDSALVNRPPGATILLSHQPRLAEKAAQEGVALMLSGHTHGGQIWPFGYLVARVYPLLAGRYDVGGMKVIVSRGTGTWGPRMRLWRRGEILRITLLKGERSVE